MPATVPLVEPAEANTLLPAPTTSPTARTVINFHRRQWVSRDNRLTLAVTATAQLVWPPSAASPVLSSNIFNAETVPAACVAQLVRSGRLWIGTGGRSIQFGVKATLGGRSCIKHEQLHMLTQLIASWPWSELGLVEDRSRGEANEFVLCHPPSPNGLYAPHGIPHARMDRVDCQLRFNYCPDGFQLHAPPVTRLPEQKPLGKKKKKKAKTKRTPPKTPKTMKPARTLTNPACLFDEDDRSWERTCAMVEAALATFVGVKGRQVGARPLDQQSLPSGAPSLLDVAPAVWSYQLFRAAASRAANVPLIYRALSAFTNAQSPSLRRKTEALTRLPATAGQPSSQEGLATKIEEILLKGTLFKPQRLKRSGGGSRRARPDMLSQVSSSSSSSHLPCPELTTASSSQESCELMEADVDEGLFYDVDVDNFEHAFGLLQGDEYGEGESDAGEAVDWDDIEAWTEPPDDWPEDDDDDGDAFFEIDSNWSPLWYGDEEEEEEEEEGEDWQDVEDGQLEAALSVFEDSQQEARSPWCEDEQYMDVDEMGLCYMGAEDGYEADEGIGMWQWQWRNEHELIEHIL